MSKRLNWIDSSRGVGMICVYIYHTGYHTPYHQVFDYFLIPIFFFISGYLFNEKRTLREGFSRLYHRLIVPYIILGFIFSISIKAYLRGGVISCLCHSAKSVIGGTTLWFVSCLILIEAISLLLSHMYKGWKSRHIVLLKIAVIVFSSMFILICRKITKDDFPYFQIWRWYNALCGIGYFYIGNLYRSYENRFKVVERYGWFVALSYVCLALVCSFFLDSHIDFVSATFRKPLVSLMLSWLSLWAMVCFTKKMRKVGWLEQIGKDTLFLFAVNFWLIKGIVYVFSKLHFCNYVPYWGYGLLITFTALLVASVLNKIVRAYAPLTIGEQKKRQ